MADMYGALRSNWFTPTDVEACKHFLTEEVSFGGIHVFDYRDGTLAIGGELQYPSAMPQKPMGEDDDYPQEWDLEEFAIAMRKHLAPGEEFRVFAAGNEKLRYVAANYLVVTHNTVDFTSYYEGN